MHKRFLQHGKYEKSNIDYNQMKPISKPHCLASDLLKKNLEINKHYIGQNKMYEEASNKMLILIQLV